jgi:hypothetical protein
VVVLKMGAAVSNRDYSGAVGVLNDEVAKDKPGWWCSGSSRQIFFIEFTRWLRLLIGSGIAAASTKRPQARTGRRFAEHMPTSLSVNISV